MITSVAKLGYLNGRLLDVTFGYGNFWSLWQPPDLVACDLDPAKSPVGYPVDFTHLPSEWMGEFDTIVLDPPYKLNGRPTDAVDERYGVASRATVQERYSLIDRGIGECARFTKRYLLLKCMDQVVSGRKHWQTIHFANYASLHGMALVDRFDLLVTPRPQPAGRRQVHTQANYSTLLVFEK